MTTVPIWVLDTVSIHPSHDCSMPMKPTHTHTPPAGLPCEKELCQVSHSKSEEDWKNRLEYFQNKNTKCPDLGGTTGGLQPEIPLRWDFMFIHIMINDNNSNSNTNCVDRLLDLKAQSMAATLRYSYLQSVFGWFMYYMLFKNRKMVMFFECILWPIQKKIFTFLM